MAEPSSFDYESLDSLALWPHQEDAIAKMAAYFTDFRNETVTGSALVHMPTGSGKTGVITALSRCIPEIGCVLVLTPRVALRRQLVRDIGNGFFDRLTPPVSSEGVPKSVIEVDGPFSNLVIKDFSDSVLVSTIQKVQTMARTDLESFEKMKSEVSLLVFDEGHYEPALTWSQTIRQFGSPKIIFTATPYRNDLKTFDLNLNHAFSYTYHEAVNDRYLRNVEIIQRVTTDDPVVFVDDILNFYDEIIANIDKDTRVIIRCDRRSTIRQIAKVLKDRRRKYISIHATFSDTGDDPSEHKTVPDPTNEDAIFWIHQFKLMEGIDDKRFGILASFEPYRSARPIIQQIGRIVRNPDRKPGSIAYVLDHSGGFQAKLWDGYLAYDNAIFQQGKDGLNLAIGETWKARLIAGHSGLAYLGGRFRSELDMDTLLPSEELRIPLKANLLHKLDGFELDRFADILHSSYEDEDRVVRRFDESDKTCVFVYIVGKHSPLLETSHFVEPKLGVSIIHDLDDFVAFYDTLGRAPLNFEPARIGKALDPTMLKRLFRQHSGSYLTNISLKNSNLGHRSVRARSVSAAVLRDTISPLDDHAQICTTARGFSIDDPTDSSSKTHRYVGFHRGRVSDSSGTNGTLAEYIEWLEDIKKIVVSRKKSLTTFRRYAPDEIEITDPTPLHILLDLFEIEQSYVTIDGSVAKRPETMQIDDLSSKITNGEFEIIANGTNQSIQIMYNPERNNYILRSPSLDRMYKNTDPNDNRGLIDYLNQSQSFRIIPKSKNRIYVLGQFYQPIFKVGRSFDPDTFELIKVLHPSETLESCGSEKGDTFPDDRSGWHENSLFGIIDRLGHGTNIATLFGDPDIVVCDDPDTEIADFIIGDTKKNRIIMVHAKASREIKPYSASSLQEVCGQVSKNINYLGMFLNETPPNLKHWDKPWPNAVNPKVEKKIRRGKKPATQAWSNIFSIIRNPLADREVWIFLGKILSKSTLIDHLGKPNPTPEAVQAAYLLHATMTSAGSVGAKLRVFCSP